MKVTIAGKDYQLDVDQALKTGVLTKFSVKMGDRFRTDGGDYILVSPVENEAILVNLRTGIRWRGAVQIQEMSDISLDEWDKIAGLQYNFVKI